MGIKIWAFVAGVIMIGYAFSDGIATGIVGTILILFLWSKILKDE